ncbi:MAG: hypothetical protein WC635_10670 [Bacteriovorax sp.]
MKKNLILNSLLVFSVSAFSYGCKIKQNIDEKIPPEGLGGITAPAPRNYTVNELEIGKRICSNLKKKREFFEGLSNEKEQFKFRAELRDCNNTLYNAELFLATISNANSTEPEYIALRDTYFKDVTTDQSGIMKSQCDLLIQSDVVANNIISGNYKYTINLMIDGGFDTYQVVKARKNADGSYGILSSESVKLISNSTQASLKFLGVEKDRVRYTACEGKKYSTVRQIWVEAVTNF